MAPRKPYGPRSADTIAAIERGTSRQNENKRRARGTSGTDAEELVRAKVALTMLRARREKVELESLQGTLVPMDDAAKVIEEATRQIQNTLDAAVETGAVALNAAHAVPLPDARAWLRGWYQAAMSRAADRMDGETYG